MSSSNESLDEIVVRATENFTKIISTNDIKIHYKELYWGGNGVGDRWVKKRFNYSVIYKKREPFLYSENEEDKIPDDLLKDFLEKNEGNGIIGIFVHSIRMNSQKRPISKKIQKKIISMSCVVCGTKNTICDHKNDLYNETRVLSIETQDLGDFQALCNHCNLQKRQVSKEEENLKKIYSAKRIAKYKVYDFEFPWEKKVYDKTDINCKTGTYWYDPIEFQKKIYYYSLYVIPIVKEIKCKIKKIDERRFV